MRSPDQPSPEVRLPPLIVICGATATGKTPLSLALAERLGSTEIVSADSRQVYRGMDVGTAKVSAEDRARVPHHGLDLVDPDEPFTAADFQRHATSGLAGIAQRDRVALLVGGTGLYVRALARGLPLSETGRHSTVRARLEARLDAEGLAPLAAELRARAPQVAGATDLANPRRVVRALERVTVTGDAPPPGPRGYPKTVVWLGLQLEPEEHRVRIRDRARQQFETGLLDEAAALRARYPPTLPAFSAVGYREAFAVLEGELTTDEAVERTITRTSQLARRQRTWFRAEPDIVWLPASDDAADLAAAIVAAAFERADLELVDNLGHA